MTSALPVERRVTAGGVRTRVLEVAGAGPPLLLLHGYSDSADTWRPLMRELGARGRWAIAVDQPGFGHCEGRGPGPLVEANDKLVAAFIREHLAGEQVVVAGNSMGGVSALRAAQNPELPIAGIVPVSPAGLGHQRWVDVLEREPVVHLILTSRIPLPMGLVRLLAPVIFRRLACGQPGKVDPGVVAAYASQFQGRESVSRLVGDARKLLGELRDPFELERITCPVLLVWGKRDRLIPWKSSQLVLDAVPGSELVLFDQAGHCSQAEEPERLAEVLVEFSERVAPASHSAAGAS